jgi:hypothetical protein
MGYNGPPFILFKKIRLNSMIEASIQCVWISAISSLHYGSAH